MDFLSRTLALYSSRYGNYIVIDGFNIEEDGTAVLDFWSSFDLLSLIWEPKCCKSREKPSYIDLILTNKPHNFQDFCVTETGLSDFHMMILTDL